MRGTLPSQIGPYRIREEVARGGMGVVYRAWHAATEREVALKVLRERGASGEERARFQREAMATARVEHPNVVRVFDARVSGEHMYFAMELVEGSTLKERLARVGPLSGAEVVRVLRPVAEALVEAHARGVLHRDLKPENVLLDPGGEPKLTDFGLAKLLDLEATRLTEEGQSPGTLAFMAPEQLSGGEIGAAVDVYGFGVLLYACLTGRRPFEADSPIGMVRAVLEVTPEPPTGPERLVALCGACMAKSPAERPESMQAVLEALTQALDPVALPSWGWRWAGWVVALGVGAGAGAVGGREEAPVAAEVVTEDVGEVAAAPVPEPAVWLAQARGLLRCEAQAEAQRLLEEATRVWPESGVLWAELGLMLRERHQLEASYAAFERAREASPEKMEWVAEQALVVLQQGDASGALRRVERAFAQAPESWEVRGIRAVVWGHVERLEEALRELDLVVVARPQWARGWAYRGGVSYMARDWDASWEDMTAALELAPWNAQFLSNRGLVSVRRGRYTEAEEDFRRALRLDPDYVSGWIGLAVLFESLQDWRKLLGASEQVLRLDPDSPTGLIMRGKARLGLGEAGGREDLERVVASLPSGDPLREQAEGLLKRRGN